MKLSKIFALSANIIALSAELQGALVNTNMQIDTSATLGLREQKRRDTYLRIVDAGMRLFVEHGYHATTLDAIAVAAGISRRTFFSYFAGKEDLLVAWHRGCWSPLLEDIAVASRDEIPFQLIRRVFNDHLSRHANDEIVAMEELMHITEKLRMSFHASFIEWERALLQTLIMVWPEPERRSELRMVATLWVATFRSAMEEWQANSRHVHLAQHLEEACQLCEQILVSMKKS